MTTRKTFATNKTALVAQASCLRGFNELLRALCASVLISSTSPESLPNA